MKEMDINLFINILTFLLVLITVLITLIKEENLIRNSYQKIKTLFRVYLLWSKKDRIRAKEIREKYQLPQGIWTKNEPIISKMVGHKR